MRPSLDVTYLRIASAWAERGACARRQVGCVLVDADGYELSSGFNGPGSGLPHCGHAPGALPCAGALHAPGTGLDDCEALHAEWNALLRCPDVRRIRTCYCTESCCITCVKLLLNTPCRRIVFLRPYAHDAEARGRWTRDPLPAVRDQDLVELGKLIGATPRPVYRTWEHLADGV